MKHSFISTLKAATLGLALLFSGSTWAQLSGTVTLGSGGTYSSWMALASALNNSGVSGPLTVNVTSDLNEGSSTITFNAITGASSTNKITINGNGYKLTSSSSYEVIVLNGTDYMTFNNVNVINTSTSAYGIGYRLGNDATYNVIKGGSIEFTARTTTSSYGAYVALASSYSALMSSSSSWNGRYNRVSGVTMKSTASGSYGPYYGIANNGNSSYYSSSSVHGGNMFENNDIQKFYLYGITMYYTNGDSAIGNDMSGMNQSSYYGVYGYYSYYCWANDNDLSGNTITSTYYGIMPYYYCYYWMVDGNNMSNNKVSSTYIGIYNYYYNYYTTIKNNTMDNNSAATYYGLYAYYYPMYSTWDNNSMSGNTVSSTYYGMYAYYYPQYCTISNNHMDKNSVGGVYYGIYNYYYLSDGKFIKNTMDGNKVASTFYGIYAYYYAQYEKIEYNSISDNTVTGSTFYGTYMYYYAYNTSVSFNKVNRNVVYSAFYGIYRGYYHDYYITSDNEICNNESQASSMYCIYNIYGYYDVQISRNKIRSNKSSSALIGIYGYAYPTAGYKISVEDNTIDSNYATNSYTVGMYIYYGDQNIRRNHVTENRGNGSDAAGIFSYYAMGLNCESNLVANVTSYYYDVYAFYLYNSSYTGGPGWNIRQNTIYNKMKNYSSGSYINYGFHNGYTLSSNQNWVGNLVYCEGGNTITPQYHINNNGTITQYSDNTWFTKPDANTSGYQWQNTSGTYASFAAYNASGFAQRELFLDPRFEDPTKDKFASGQFKNQNTVASTNASALDLYNVKRATPKSDRGAIEGYLDLQLLGLSFSPAMADTVCSGSEYTVNVKIGNLFMDTATDIPLAFNVNGKVTMATAKVSIAPNDSASYTLQTKLKLNQWGVNTVVVSLAGDDNPKNDSFSRTVVVKPAPGGSEFNASSKPTQARYFRGTPQDLTILKNKVIYDINAPRNFSNSGYGSTWTASAYAKKQSGATVTGVNLVAPSGSNDMELSFVTSDKSLEDSIITVCLKITDLKNGCDTLICRNVFIYPSIVPGFKFPSKICNGDAVLFENTSTVRSGGMEFFWNFGTGNAADTSNAPEPVFQFPASGKYKVILTAKTLPYGFEFYDTQEVNVNAIPTVAFDKKNACEGEALSFTNKTTPATATSKWAFGDGATSTTANPTHLYAKAGTYNVTLTADLNGCVATLTQRVYQFDKPKADWSLLSGSCDNDEFEFANKSSISSGLAGSYWDFNDNGAVSTDDNPTYMFASSGSKNVKLVSISEFGCKDSMTKAITVKESPKVSYTANAACSLTPTSFTNTTPDVAGTVANYTWDFGDGTKSTAKSPTKNWSSLGPKTIKLTVSLDNGCTQSISKDVNVLTQPKASFTASDVCAGDAVIFVNNTTWPQGEISYSWDFGDNTASSSSDPSKTYNVVQTTSYNVTLYAYIKGGCADSITQRVTINEAPRTCDFVANADYGFGFHGVTLDPVDGSGNVGGQDNVDYTWVFEGGGKLTSADKNATVQYNLQDDGTYTITMRAKVRQTGCECTVSKDFVMNRSAAEGLAKSGVGVYPNPTEGKFFVATTADFGQTFSLVLTNVNGQIVYSNTVENNGLMEINASDLSSGVYVLIIQSENKRVTQKITKTN
jgi:parallel beta-helix repeat protein